MYIAKDDDYKERLRDHVDDVLPIMIARIEKDLIPLGGLGHFLITTLQINTGSDVLDGVCETFVCSSVSRNADGDDHMDDSYLNDVYLDACCDLRKLNTCSSGC